MGAAKVGAAETQGHEQERIMLGTLGRYLAKSLYGVFSGPLGQCISVTYPRRTAGRRLDNLGVRMREQFRIFEKFTRSTFSDHVTRNASASHNNEA